MTVLQKVLKVKTVKVKHVASLQKDPKSNWAFIGRFADYMCAMYRTAKRGRFQPCQRAMKYAFASFASFALQDLSEMRFWKASSALEQ